MPEKALGERMKDEIECFGDGGAHYDVKSRGLVCLNLELWITLLWTLLDSYVLIIFLGYQYLLHPIAP